MTTPQSPGPWQPGGHDQPYQGQPHPAQQWQPAPARQPAEKKSGCMKWALIIIGVLILVATCSALVSGEDEDADSAVEASTTLPAPAPADAEPSDAVPEAAPEPAPEQQPESAAPEVPREHQNALKAAERYLAYTSFSKQGLVEQLECEDYSPEAAQYGAEEVGADWDEQAVKQGERYLDYTSFSQQGLVDQLMFDGFTAEQAQAAASRLF